MSDRTAELYGKIMDASATEEEIEEYLGPRLNMELAARWRGPEATRRAFRRWHRAVTGPIGVDERLAFDLFVGRIGSEEFEQALDPETTRAFLEQFEELQTAYQARLDGEDEQR